MSRLLLNLVGALLVNRHWHIRKSEGIELLGPDGALIEGLGIERMTPVGRSFMEHRVTPIRK